MRLHGGDHYVPRWCVGNKPNWLTDNGRDQIAHITEEHGGEGVHARRSRTRAVFLRLLCSCDESPVLLLGEVTPRGIMEFAMGRRRVRGGQGYLSKSAYGQICAAVLHLFHVHNCVGFSENFRKELGNYFRGSYRQLIQQPHQQEAIGEPLQVSGGAGAVVVNPAPCRRRINKEGKDPMSVDLYKKLCGWLLDWNTNDGVFGHCFLVLTWNLSCRAHNTANIQLCENEWGSTFDAFEIYFAHTKTDQTGDEAKYSRHLYANPFCHLICPVLSLAFYFSCCCNLPQTGESRLFHALFIIRRSVCRSLSDNVAIIADCRWSLRRPPPPPPPPPILFQHGMTGGKPTVPSSSLCLMIFHSFCGLN